MEFSEKDFRHGNLVVNKYKHYGIVVDSRNEELIVLTGAGTNQVGEGDIPNCFVELLPVYEYSSPDDVRVTLRKMQNEIEIMRSDIGESAWAISALADKVDEIEKLPKAVMNRIKGRGEIDVTAEDG